MKLYLVRHGIAEDRRAGMADAERALTAGGRARTAACAAGLKALGCTPARIVSSPLLRARETADILRGVLAVEAAIVVSDTLVPMAAPQHTIAALPPWRAGAVMLVGHLPHIAALAATLIAPEGRAAVLFKKAAACCIDLGRHGAGAPGTLEWLLQPAQLRRLAGEID